MTQPDDLIGYVLLKYISAGIQNKSAGSPPFKNVDVDISSDMYTQLTMFSIPFPPDIRLRFIFAWVSDTVLPLVLIPTTCGTGSEGNGFAVLTNPENGDKKSLRCNAIVAKVSIVDPDCMKTMPKHVLAAVGFDALCHCMEAYTSKISQPFTDALALYAIDLIAHNLVDVYKGRGTQESWEKITLASTIGGMVINTAGVTLAHGMEHPASGLKDIVHGKGLAALTPVIIEASYKGDHFKFAKIARIFGGITADDLAPKIRTLLKNLDLDVKLSDLGIEEKDIPWMAENCMKVSAASIANNPVVFTQEEITEIYKKAM